MNKTTPAIRGTTPEIERRAKQMRHEMTPAESTLWQALQGRSLQELRFRAQHPVGRFILDFYCPAYKLAVEADGEVHVEQAERDAERTAHLVGHGYRVLRFQNAEIENNLPEVLRRILETVEALRAEGSRNQTEEGPL